MSFIRNLLKKTARAVGMGGALARTTSPGEALALAVAAAIGADAPDVAQRSGRSVRWHDIIESRRKRGVRTDRGQRHALRARLMQTTPPGPPRS